MTLAQMPLHQLAKRHHGHRLQEGEALAQLQCVLLCTMLRWQVDANMLQKLNRNLLLLSRSWAVAEPFPLPFTCLPPGILAAKDDNYKVKYRYALQCDVSAAALV